MALKKSHRDFRAALRQWVIDNPLALEWQNQWVARRALFAAWWFIENVSADDPARSDIYWELRPIVYHGRTQEDSWMTQKAARSA